MGTATATVETLTAEVRVLMVGSRQVTLSVYRQLDSVDMWDMEPFGRVRTAKAVGYGAPSFSVEVVGRRANSGEPGELVAGSYCKPPRNIEMDNFHEWVDPAVAHWVWHSIKSNGYATDRACTYADVGFLIKYDWNYKSAEHDCPVTGFDESSPEALAAREFFKSEADKHNANRRRWQEFSELPLIVLAGLK